jgi:hypothetical protein
MTSAKKYLSIYSPSTAVQRQENFEEYWVFSRNHGGEIIESEQNLTKKHSILQNFQATRPTLKYPLPHPEIFYRNYVHCVDDVKSLDQKTLLLTCIYKFARHEWVGITGAWAATPNMESCKVLTDRISRYHLAEEFSHTRLFHEMLETCGLHDVKWVPLGPIAQKVYEIFPVLPEAWMSPFAFVTEMMGIIFYRKVDELLVEVFADEPEVCARLRELLNEITVDELAHIGQRRNYLGSLGIKISKWITPLLFKMFFSDIPETRLLLDMDKAIQDALDFDYSEIPGFILEKSWVPSYCIAAA